MWWSETFYGKEIKIWNLSVLRLAGGIWLFLPKIEREGEMEQSFIYNKNGCKVEKLINVRI